MPPVATSSRYDTIGQGYSAHRRPDPRWEALIWAELAGARRIVNIGAGTGSYEPLADMAEVIAIEPSPVMVAQRSPRCAPAIRASASALPLADRSVDACLAVLTVHHWGDWAAGLSELRRVARRRVILAIDHEIHASFWLLRDYLPEVAASTARLTPGIEEIAQHLPRTSLHLLPLPTDMVDGVLGAYWQRPQAYLDPTVRANCSGIALADQALVECGVARLADDLRDGTWERRYGELRQRDHLDVGYRLLISDDG